MLAENRWLHTTGNVSVLDERQIAVLQFRPLGPGMDYNLQNLRTGESHSLDPHRTLIGSAEHATIRVAEGGPFLGVLIVRYPTGWAVHGLADDVSVTYNSKPLKVTRQVAPEAGDVLGIGDELFRFVVVANSYRKPKSAFLGTPPSCFAYIHFPDGMDECRVVDHNLLFGRLRACHVRYPDTKLSRLNALLATHGDRWYVHVLSKNIIARNRQAVSGYAALEDGDELLIGPLTVRVELRADGENIPSSMAGMAEDGVQGLEESRSETPSAVTDLPTITIEAPAPPPPAPPTPLEVPPGMHALYNSGLRLDHWLKSQKPTPDSNGGIASWFGSQHQRLKRFWYDTPEATAARSLRTAGSLEEAFATLDRAIRARPDSPELLRELYRLYEAMGLLDLCYRPLRQIEKLAAAGGGTDPWVLETLARLCERLGRHRPSMFDRAIGYWNKLERTTGVSYSQERSAALANRALCEAGFARIAQPGLDDD
jgi:hypothetical protein